MKENRLSNRLDYSSHTLLLVEPCQDYKIDRFLLLQKMSEICQYN